MRPAILILAIALSACEEGNPGASVDYDAMNRAAEGPARQIDPQPIGTGELTRFGLSRGTCVVPGANHRENLFAASREKGIMRIDFETMEFAPRPTSDPLPNNVANGFDGTDYQVELTVDRSSETPAGPEQLFFNGTLTVRDARERIVFEHRGRVECSWPG
ncbi:hypothetical protein [Erythrobacter sp.]|jgi:hypothetical protein|uniref:hypothetical protein n=1 Tax=Erythrobacter sp. TaxID=1042 RepID=UPI002EB64D0C|nr:hypothetical protein [Erythrobacter sp.]